MINNYESSYEDLLNKNGKSNMKLRRIRSLCTEIDKTLNNLNPEFMKDVFRISTTERVQREKCKFKLEIPKPNQLTLGTRSLRIQGPKVWNSSPYHIKGALSILATERPLTMMKNFNLNVRCQDVV